jgi:hypothetical protein
VQAQQQSATKGSSSSSKAAWHNSIQSPPSLTTHTINTHEAHKTRMRDAHHRLLAHLGDLNQAQLKLFSPTLFRTYSQRNHTLNEHQHVPSPEPPTHAHSTSSKCFFPVAPMPRMHTRKLYSAAVKHRWHRWHYAHSNESRSDSATVGHQVSSQPARRRRRGREKAPFLQRWASA